MVINLRVSRDFTKAKANDLVNITDNVSDGMLNNPAYQNSPVPPVDLSALNVILRTAITAADAGGPVQTAAKNKAYAAVTDALRKNASYVEIQANNDLEVLLSSGFNAVSTNRAQAPLVQPVILQLSNLGTSQLLLRMGSVLNAKAYQIQTTTTASGPWTDYRISTQARRNVLAGMTPGTVYYIRARAVGGSTGYSDWSIPASTMVT